MNKREFLKTSGTLIASSMLPRFAQSQTVQSETVQSHIVKTRANWAGNLTYSTDRLDTPGTVEDLRHAIAGHMHLRALGARHSFNTIADSPDAQVSLGHFDHVELDPKAATVTLGAGVSYGKLAPVLDAAGFAVHNLASLPHIGVVGACATATHGSGLNNGNLSTAVRAMEIVTASGDLVTLSPATLGDRFAATVVHLGALGVVTRITLAVEPSFQVTQNVFLDLPFSALEHNLEAIFASGYSVSLFTNWQGSHATQVWIKRRADAPGTPFENTFFGAKPATRKMHPILDHPAEACTEQFGIPGPSFERLPHFRMNFTPSSGQELQTEYFVPLEHAYHAIRAVEQLRDRITPHLFISEFRTVAADTLWLSPSYERASMTIHFTWKPEWPAVREILPLIEAKLAPFQPRPHWAKLFTIPPATVQTQYTNLPGYKALLAQYDPEAKFRNPFLDHVLYTA